MLEARSLLRLPSIAALLPSIASLLSSICTLLSSMSTLLHGFSRGIWTVVVVSTTLLLTGEATLLWCSCSMEAALLRSREAALLRSMETGALRPRRVSSPATTRGNVVVHSLRLLSWIPWLMILSLGVLLSIHSLLAHAWWWQ